MTNAELAVLTLVAEEPRHGYAIEQVIEARGMREWTEVGFSSIYYLLGKLEERGLVESQPADSPGQGPPRKVYHITEAGRQACHEGLLEALSTPKRPFSPLQLALANLPALSREEAVKGLGAYRQQLLARQEDLWRKRLRQPSLPYFVEAMFSHSLALIQAELEWTESFMEKLEQRDEEDRP
jgi:DNA-binding PadR family transcriptional regulator